MPRYPGSSSTASSTERTRTDLLATRIGEPAARSSIENAFQASASTESAAKGGSSCAVAAWSCGHQRAGSVQGVDAAVDPGRTSLINERPSPG